MFFTPATILHVSALTTYGLVHTVTTYKTQQKRVACLADRRLAIGMEHIHSQSRSAVVRKTGWRSSQNNKSRTLGCAMRLAASSNAHSQKSFTLALSRSGALSEDKTGLTFSSWKLRPMRP